MLFNSVIFITIFLPLSLTGWFLLQKLENPAYAKIFLCGMSLWFYGYYNPYYLFLLLLSILANFTCSRLLEQHKNSLQENYEKCHSSNSRDSGRRTYGDKNRKWAFSAGILFNLGILFYFKYFNFFLDNCNFLLHTDWHLEKIALPLGISFFTFQQISFLVDCYRQESSNYSFLDYTCFITFFPQLIAGPIVLHKEFIPQLNARKNRKINSELFFDGVALFILGMGKKVLLADVLAIIVNAEYGSIAYLDAPSAWITIIFYMLELYFDFSGYCDMARGIGKMFGFLLPQNFDSPLKAVSVRDFWRRWHITLSRFLGTYIYIPLGGNRRGLFIKCRNLLIVFFISGLWHGANWTFIIWGGLHGLAMVWETLFPNLHFRSERLNRIATAIYVTFTFSIFRSANLQEAWLLITRLFTGRFTNYFLGLCNTLQIPETYVIRKFLQLRFPDYLNLFYVLCILLLFLISILLISGPTAEKWIEKNGITSKGIFVLATLFVWALLSLSQVSTFLYFDF